MAGLSLLRIHHRVVTSGVSVVSVRGEIDLATVETFREILSSYLATPSTTHLVCDLTQVRFLACSGLAVLLDTQTALSARGARMTVAANHPAVLRPVTVTGLRERLAVRPTLSAALVESSVD